METLVTIQNGKTMTSLEIAELTGKRHDNVLRAIRSMEPAWIKVTGVKFNVLTFEDVKGEKRPMFELTKTECLYIATKFNDEARARLVIRWEELEMKEATITNTNEIIPVEKGRLGLEVNSRELHKKLKSGRQYADWIKSRIEKYGFEEGIEFFINVRKSQPSKYRGGRDGACPVSTIERRRRSGAGYRLPYPRTAPAACSGLFILTASGGLCRDGACPVSTTVKRLNS